MRTILELRHIDCEPPAAYLPALDEFGDVRTVRTWQEPIPDDPREFSAIIVMGGPMGVGDRDDIDWIAQEIDFLTRAVAADVPVWGVCLGSQLLAAALGAEVTTGAVPEVGVGHGDVDDAASDDPVWGAENVSSFPALQWHSDTFDIPEGATLLASSDAYPHQVFRHGRSYGIQFHLEADAVLAKHWLEVDEYRDALEAAIGSAAVPGFVDDITAAESVTRPLAVRVSSGGWP